MGFSLAKYFSDYIDYNNKHNIPPVLFIHTKCVFFKPHNNSLNKYMILNTSKPRHATMTSYRLLDKTMDIESRKQILKISLYLS